MRHWIAGSAAAVAALALSGAPTGAGATPPAWTATAAFAPPEGAAPGAPFAGRLDLATTEMTVETTPPDAMIRTPWAWWGIFDFLAAQDPPGAPPLLELDAQLFPGLSVELVATEAGDLIPVERGLIRRPVAERTPSFWEMIAGPGRTWALEGAEAGWSRAAFPLSLAQSQEGEAWVGLASFDYRGTEATDLRVAFGPVSAGGFIFWDADFDVAAWAEVPATLAPGDADAAAVEAAYAAEAEGRLPLRPLADLGEGVVAAAAALDPKGTLAVAVLRDGTLHMDPVGTPFGPHPYPQDMRVGVWSATKSLIPGLAAMRMAERYGAEVLDTPIVSLFEEGAEFAYVDDAARARWAGVTIRHALDMATGMGAIGYDPNWATDNANTYAWSYSYDLADQVRAYFNVGPNPDVTGPGQAMAYIDQDMWIATLALQRILQSREGEGATILGMLRDEVYEPIGAHHFASGTGYTPDGSEGMPFAAWGALPTIDILARAGRLVAEGGRGPDGAQILDPALVASLSASPDYGLAFWRLAVPTPDGEVLVPHMSGAGGNVVMALPDGSSVVVLGRDSYNVEHADEALAALAAAVLAAP